MSGGNKEQRPLVGVGVVFIRDGMIFLAKRSGSHGDATWGSAGGHLEFGESLEACARREAKEELGVDVGEMTFLCIANIIDYGVHYLDVEFLGDIGDQIPRAVEEDSFTEMGWFPLDKLPEVLFAPMRYAIDSLKSGSIYHNISE